MNTIKNNLYLTPTVVEVDANNIVDELNGIFGIRVFDNLEYAKEFCKGKFLTRTLSFYANLQETDPRYDPAEGFFEQIVKVDINKSSQEIPSIFNINKLTFFTDIAKNNGFDLKDKLLFIEHKSDTQALCTYAWPSNQINTLDKSVVANMLAKGNFAVLYKIPDLAKNIIEKCQDFLTAGFVLYNDNYSKHPFIKSSKYKQEHEFRFLFLTKEAQSFRQTNALPWYKLYDIKSGNLIGSSNDIDE